MMEAARYDDTTLIYDLRHGFLLLAQPRRLETLNNAHRPRRFQRYAYGNG
jgi:hypothetical protein